jgi:hypothetical protein
MDLSSTGSQNPYASPAIPKESERPSLPPSANKPNEPLAQPIRISGALTMEDYFRGGRLGKRWQKRFFISVCIIGLLVVWGIDYEEFLQGNYLTIAVITTILLAIWTLFYIGAQWLVHSRFRKACASGKGVFAPTEGIITEEDYEVHQEIGDAKYRWSAFSKFRSTDQVAVLFVEGSPFHFGIIPRGKFQTQHDWECFIGLLDRKLPRC